MNSSCSFRDCLAYLWTFLVCAAALVMVMPAVLDPSVQPVGWDDTHYLHRTTCLNHALFALDLPGLWSCLKEAHKSPLMSFIGLPWGPQAGTAQGLGLVFVSLAVVTFAVFLAVAEMMVRLAIPRLLILGAFAVIALNPLLPVVAGAYQGDILHAALVALFCLLVFQELNLPEPGARSSLVRGATWGLIAALGIMAKISFFFFAALLGPAMLIIRIQRSGWRDGLLALLAALLVAAPVLALHFFHREVLFGHALRSSIGPLAEQTSYGLTFISYFQELAQRTRGTGFALIALAFFAWMYAYASPPQSLLARFLPFCALCLYLILVGLSPNHDMRYAFPFLIAAPVVLAAVASPTDEEASYTSASISLSRFLTLLLAGALAAVPMTGRPDLTHVRTAETALRSLPPSQPLNVMLASDDSAFNIETFKLAQQLAFPALAALRIGTVVYDPAAGRSVEESIKTLEAADVVIMLRTPVREAPEWTNANAARFRQVLDASSRFRRSDEAGGVITLYRRADLP